MTWIAFDFDMTLADSAEAVIESLYLAFKGSGLIIEREEIENQFWKIKGRKVEDQIKHFLPKRDLISLSPIVHNAFMEHYSMVGLEKTKPFDGTVDLICFLRQYDFKIVIVSAKSIVNLDKSLRILHIETDKVLGNLYGFEKTQKIKEHSALAYVGDLEVDVEIAQAADCLSIILNTQSEEIANWQKKPNYQFTTPRKFLSWLQQENNLKKLNSEPDNLRHLDRS